MRGRLLALFPLIPMPRPDFAWVTFRNLILVVLSLALLGGALFFMRLSRWRRSRLALARTRSLVESVFLWIVAGLFVAFLDFGMTIVLGHAGDAAMTGGFVQIFCLCLLAFLCTGIFAANRLPPADPEPSERRCPPVAEG